MRKLHVVVALLVAALLAVGCGQNVEDLPMMDMTPEATEAPGMDDGDADDVEVLMQNVEFQPQEITVSPGTTVTWTNGDSVDHTVTSGPRGNPTDLFNETVGPGETFFYTFDEPGTYEYHCTLHPNMDGTVIVQ